MRRKNNGFNDSPYNPVLLSKAIIQTDVKFNSPIENLLLNTTDENNKVKFTFPSAVTKAYQRGTAIEAVFNHFTEIMKDICEAIEDLIPQNFSTSPSDLISQVDNYRTMLSDYKSSNGEDVHERKWNPLLYAAGACTGITREVIQTSLEYFLSCLLPTPEEYFKGIEQKNLVYYKEEEAYQKILESARDLSTKHFKVPLFGDYYKNSFIDGLFLLESVLCKEGLIDKLIDSERFLEAAAIIAILENKFISPSFYLRSGVPVHEMERLIEKIQYLPKNESIYEEWLRLAILNRLMGSVFTESNINYYKNKNM